MDQSFGIETNVSLTQALSPQMMQSLAILQCTSLELDTAITAALESNPLLEEETSDESVEPVSDDSDSAPGIDVDTTDDFYGATTTEDWVGSPSAQVTLDNITRPDTLRDELIASLHTWEPSLGIVRMLATEKSTVEHFMDVMRYVIDSLDDDGLLSHDPSIPRGSVSDPDMESVERYIDGDPLDSLTEIAREAILAVRNIGPSGIATRNMRECLLRQARDYLLPDLTIEIIDAYYDDMVAMKFGKIAEYMKLTTKEVRDAVSRISELKVHPGRRLGDPATPIYPEVQFIRKGRRVIPLAVRTTRKISINEAYARMADDPGMSKADRSYFKSHIAEAKLFLKAIGDRYDTIERVCGAIIARQAAYFSSNGGSLVPMTLADIAADTGLAQSTVSRVTSGKYADTENGMLELGSLFTTALKTSDHGNVSTRTVIDRIKAIIDAENPAKPVSDQEITDTLVNEGFKVSRRAVAKYRENNLHILSTRHRKK